MPSVISVIVTDAETAIKGITPLDEPAWPWVLYSGEHPLDAADVQARERIRLFSVIPQTDLDDQGDRGGLTHIESTLYVEIRYLVPESRGGYRRAMTLATADAASIKHRLEKTFAWPNAAAVGFDYIIMKNSRPRPRHLGGGAYHLRLEFETHYGVSG